MDGEEKGKKAAFEAGIKLGALFHQFIGAPVSLENAEILEKAIESCVKLQPFVVDVGVKIDREKLKEKLSSFNYTSLTGDMLEAWVKVEVDGEAVSAHLRWDEEKRYPLMSLE